MNDILPQKPTCCCSLLLLLTAFFIGGSLGQNFADYDNPVEVDESVLRAFGRPWKSDSSQIVVDRFGQKR